MNANVYYQYDIYDEDLFTSVTVHSEKRAVMMLMSEKFYRSKGCKPRDLSAFRRIGYYGEWVPWGLYDASPEAIKAGEEYINGELAPLWDTL